VLRVVRNLKDDSLVKWAQGVVKHVDEAQKEFTEVGHALTILKETPEAPDANLTVGRSSAGSSAF